MRPDASDPPRVDPPLAHASYMQLLNALTGRSPRLSTLSWNIAAVNNNPFEYFLTHPDPQYEKLMADVEAFMEAPGARDVPVSEVFTDAMYGDLVARMKARGWEVSPVASVWKDDLAGRKIVGGFLKDQGLGAKRLMSMPDRFTNTIDLAGGGLVNRPTIISNYDGDMSTPDKWWTAWTAFMFEEALALPSKKGGGTVSKVPCELLGPISRAKYPALSEAEEAMSLPLQTLCLAVFDAILLHIVRTLSPGGAWLEIKRQIIAKLLFEKERRTIAILTQTYRATDVLLLQECRGAFPAALGAATSGRYAIHAPTKPSKADQNSLICLATAAFDPASVVDVTEEAMAAVGEEVAAGDLLLVTATHRDGTRYLLGSFHGDTDGLATLPTLRAVHGVAARLKAAGGEAVVVVFGLDANVYFAPGKKQQGLDGFVAEFESLAYASSWGDDHRTPAVGYTSFCARTYLQPQLQKAVKIAERKSKGDVNLKDFLLFTRGSLHVAAAGKDNTGRAAYLDDTCLPTLQFPSDHALISATLSTQPPPSLARQLLPVAVAIAAVAAVAAKRS